MRKFIFLLNFFCLYSFIGYSQTQPVIWLRSDAMSDSMNAWPDQSPSAYHARYSKDSFRCDSDGINFNPAIKLSGNKEYFRIQYNGIETSSAVTVFSIFCTKDTTECGVWGTDSINTRKTGQTTRHVFGPDTLFLPYLKSEGKAVLNRAVQEWPSSNTVTIDSNSSLILGSFSLTQDSIPDFKGHIAEYIVFDQLLDPVEVAQIETYLSIKYATSLEQGNYVSSDKIVLWNRKNDSLYSNRITGIGRDDYWKLYQKQSSSTSEKEFLTIGASKIAKTNKENTSTINDKDFLLWGDNLGDLNLGDSSGAVMPLLNRKWKMNASGSTGKQIKTQVRLNKNQLSQQDSVYFLIIDRTASNNFSGATYIQNDGIINDSLVVFNNVSWDTDGSGSDIFSFGISKKLTLKDSVLGNPICAYSSEGKGLFNTSGGHPPYKYVARFQGSDTIAYQWNASSDSTVQPGFIGGKYKITATDAAGLVAETNLVIIAPDSIHIDLGKDRILHYRETFDFDASTQVPASKKVSYDWKGTKGFSSNSPKVKLTEPDLYILNVTNDSGCVFSDQINLLEDPLKRFDVTPTLVSSGGKVNIHIQFSEATSIQLSLVGTDGKEYWAENDEGKKSYNFNESIRDPGVYYLVLKASSSLEARKILVVQ